MSAERGSTSLAIIGIGCLFPKAPDARAYWVNIKNGIDGIGPVPTSHWNADDYFDSDPKSPDRTYAKRGGFLDPVDFRPLDFGIAPNDLEATDTSQLLGLVAAREALNDAGYGPTRTFDRNRVSVILGVTGTLELVIPLGARLGHPRWKKALANAGVPEDKASQIIDEIGGSYVGWQENSFPGLLGNVVAGRIANRLDLGGTNCVVDAACASSLSAMHLAGLELAAGRCDIALTGGVDTFNDIFMFMCFSKTPALSPSGNAKPFDANGDGTILGEGLGMVVLKRLDDAQRDGDRIYAVIKGLGSSSDGKGNAIYAPVAAGQMKALRNAYNLANVSPDTIELVEAHGTGTKVGDGVEASALTEVYRDARPEGTWCALGSVKSQIGHTKAAAGAAGLIKAALALHHKVLPPTIKVSEPLDALKTGKSPFYVNTEKRPWIANAEHPRRAAVSAFGFGGSNFHCVLEEASPKKEMIDWDGDVEIIALSSANRDGLVKKLEGWKQPRPWNVAQRDAAISRSEFSSAHNQRLMMVVLRDADLPKITEQARAKLMAEAQTPSWKLPEGIYYGCGPVTGKLAVLFPGQGSQYVGMLRDLACSFPAMQDVLAQANRVYSRWINNDNGPRLSDWIYPHSVFSRAERDEQEKNLRRTEVAQPAIGAVSLGALKILEGFGLNPDAYAGHSYGELPALCAAGCFDDEALHTMSRLRGHLMASYHGDDAGTMLAVHAPVATIENVLHEDALDLVVANRNAPLQAVLSGRRMEIDRAAAALDKRQIRHTRLPVAAAFHSPLVASAKGPFREALAELEFSQHERPVYANSTASAYPSEPEAVRELLAGQLASPVDFVNEITGMAEDGVRTFVEVGPGSTLTKLVSAILSEQPERFAGFHALALDASNGKRSGTLDLAHVLARLSACGYSLDLNNWQDGLQRTKTELPATKPGLVVPICGANYVTPQKTPARQVSNLPANSSDRLQTGPTRQTSDKSKTCPTEPKTSIPTKAMQEPTVQRVIPSPSTNGAEHKPAPVNPDALAQALQVTQQSLGAFQKLQEQTAQLHRQFLENQESAQRTLQILVEQQGALLSGRPMSIAPIARPVAPARAPEPIAAPRQVAPAPAVQARVETKPVQPRPVPVSPKPTPVAAPPKVDNTSTVLFQIISDKTGYPVEMLSPDMALDADLGIDSIKRVEIFSALQERLPESPVVKPEHLGSLQSLKDVIEFLLSVTPQAAEPPPLAASRTHEVAVATPKSDVSSVLFEIIAQKTGYPSEMLAPEMALDADLGIDSIKRVEIFSAIQERLPEAPVVKPEHLGTLHSLADVAKFLANGTNGTNGHQHPAAPVKKKLKPAEDRPAATIERSVLRAVPLQQPANTERVQLSAGSRIVVVADNSPVVSGLVDEIVASAKTVALHSWNDSPSAVSADQVAGLILIAPEQGDDAELPLKAFRWLRRFGSALRDSGKHGGAVLASITQIDGAFGLAKSVTDAQCGALAGLIKTASHEWPTVACKAIDRAAGISEGLWDEILSRGPIEVGLGADGRVQLELKQERITAGSPPFSSSDVVLVTGGARGVTAAVAQEIAEQFQPTLVLIGRTDLEQVEPAWLQRCDTEAAIKQAIFKNLSPSPSPKAVENECRAVLARREAKHNLDAIWAAGSRVIYRAIDVANPASVTTGLKAIREEVGAITHLIHGAGVLHDRLIDDLTDEQFQAVYETKVGGVEQLLSAMKDDPLKTITLFSSSTARFGRTGQAAYAAANEVLNKIAQRESRSRKGCKVVAINWGPWDGGMVNPALRQLFASEGVGVIPLKEGAEALIRELNVERSAVEVTMIARKLNVAQPATSLHSVFKQELSVEKAPILKSHIIDGRAVFPLALHLESLAHAALHGNPGLLFHGVNDLRVYQGIQVDNALAATVRAFAGGSIKSGAEFLVPVELRGERNGREIVHSRAQVVLASRLPAAAKPQAEFQTGLYRHSIEEAYAKFLFHGSELVGIEQVIGVGEQGIIGICQPAPAPAQWMHQPLRRAWIADPLIIDAAFQLMILWSFEQHGVGCLPSFVGQYRQFRKSFGTSPVRIAVRIKSQNPSMIRADIDVVDAAGEIIATMENHESVMDANLNAAFRRNQLNQGMAAVGGAGR